MNHEINLRVRVPESPIYYGHVAMAIYADVQVMRLQGNDGAADFLEQIFDAIIAAYDGSTYPGSRSLREQIHEQWEKHARGRTDGLKSLIKNFETRLVALPPDEDAEPGGGTGI